MKKEIPVQAGKTYEVKINGLGSSAEGVGRIEDFTVFVPYALPEETVEVRIVEVKKSYAKGRLLRVLKASPERIEPKCAIYDKCGGCQLQHLSYEGQMQVKQQQVVDAITRIAGLKVPVLPLIGAAAPWNYRNKMQFPVGKSQGKISIGCYAQGSHDIIDTQDCSIQKTLNNDIVNAVREVAERLHLTAYDEHRHLGLLRHVVGRVGKNGECMIVLVTSTRELRCAREIVKLLRKRLPKLVSVQQNVQTYHNNVIMGRETNLLWGRPTITDTIGSLTFHISPRSFFQVNTQQAEVLYNKAMEFANLTGQETVIDAYCGTGTITLFLARKARKVYGIEIVKPAIKDAEKNARDNRIKNAEFIVGDATDVMPRLYNQGIRADVVVVDPPRAGCTPVVLETFANMKPDRIVYVSCNPASLARDIAILDKLGYVAKKVQPVDMFPMTSHVESIALLQRKISKNP